MAHRLGIFSFTKPEWRNWSTLLLLSVCAVVFFANPALSQAEPGVGSTEIRVDATEQPSAPEDAQLQERIRKIFSNIEALSDVKVEVGDGVVKLSGNVSNDQVGERARSIVSSLAGVITVEDEIERVIELESNVKPLLADFKNDARRWLRSTPAVLLALLLFFMISYLGHRIGNATTFWHRLTGNPFLSELLGQAFRAAAVILGMVVAFNIVGANALLGTVLGGAGVVGLAVGFAVRDTLDNYVSSVMLSLRQPFRAKDRVMIDTHEGVVIRLTSRATILMTPDGNHLRIPNSTVFKAVITNFTLNPERRFDFQISLDSSMNAIEAIDAGLAELRGLDFALSQPKVNGTIDSSMDGTTLIQFTGWVDQSKTDFGRARSVSILAVQAAVNRLADEHARAQAAASAKGPADSNTELPPTFHHETARRVLDVTADGHLEARVDQDRQAGDETDLLSEERPPE